MWKRQSVWMARGIWELCSKFQIVTLHIGGSLFFFEKSHFFPEKFGKILRFHTLTQFWILWFQTVIFYRNEFCSHLSCKTFLNTESHHYLLRTSFYDDFLDMHNFWFCLLLLYYYFVQNSNWPLPPISSPKIVFDVRLKETYRREKII